jgi:CRISPR-associated protein Cas1
MFEGVPTLFVGKGGGFKGMLQHSADGQVLRRMAQYRVLDDPARQFGIAQSIVNAKLRNQQRLLLINQGRKHTWLQHHRRSLVRCQTLDSLRGHEGAAAHLYFSAITQLLSNAPIQFFGRKSYPAPDPANALLSFGYAMLQGEVCTALSLHGMDRFVGCMHRSDGHAPAAALDIMEPFRPLVDRLVLHLCRHELTPGDFEFKENSCRLQSKSRHHFYKCWENLLNSEQRWQKERLCLRALIERQVVTYANHLQDQTQILHWWRLGHG